MEPTLEELLRDPFTRAQALRAGVTSRMLQGSRFVRVYPRVWRRADHEMSHDDWVEAARLALPSTARVTGITRLQQLGLDFGPELPVHFVIEGDLHLAFEGVFLHRTKAMPPSDEFGVTAEAAFIAFCVTARVIDAIMVGNWLLHEGRMDKSCLEALATAHPWRDGAIECLWVLDHLTADSWSMKESETCAILVFAGLRCPERNQPLTLESGVTVIPDLLYRKEWFAIEYEGTHHQVDRVQYTEDLGRYAAMRGSRLDYEQVTNEKLRAPRDLVLRVHRELLKRGYDGPPPRFGETWRLLFMSLRTVVGSRDNWRERRSS